MLCIRPETSTIGLEPAAQTQLHLRAQVIRRAFLGHLMRYWVQVGDDEWIVDQTDPAATHLYDGPVVLSIAPARMHVIPPLNV